MQKVNLHIILNVRHIYLLICFYHDINLILFSAYIHNVHIYTFYDLETVSVILNFCLIKFMLHSCHKCFSDEASLLKHIPEHKQSKRSKVHICNLCGMSYTQATYLAKHMNKHSNGTLSKTEASNSDQLLKQPHEPTSDASVSAASCLSQVGIVFQIIYVSSVCDKDKTLSLKIIQENYPWNLRLVKTTKRRTFGCLSGTPPWVWMAFHQAHWTLPLSGLRPTP